MDQDAGEGAAAAAGGDGGDGEFIEAGDIAAEFEARPRIAYTTLNSLSFLYGGPPTNSSSSDANTST